jgi:FkbM family methyltransferase
MSIIPIKIKAFKLLQKIYASVPRVIPGYLGKKFRAETAEKLIVIDEVNTKYGTAKYYCMGEIPLWRSKTLFIKEPETIEWIDKMDKDDLLWDIGSNVGLYSVYAGLKGMKVFAFEPSALNTFLISKNIEINNLKDNVILFPIAISDQNEFGYLNMTSTDLGGAMHEFSEKDLKSVGGGDYEKQVVFKQGMLSYSMDELIKKYKFEVPNYIKIDVDSIEDKIIYGSRETLASKRVKGLLIELDETEVRTQKIIDFLAELGLELKEKKHSEMIANSKFKTIFNYIFEKI